MSSAGSADRDAPYFEAVWQANRAVAQAFVLTAHDFEYILSTIPVFARKRPAFYAYLKERVKEWKEEEAITRTREYPAAEALSPSSLAAEPQARFHTDPNSKT